MKQTGKVTRLELAGAAGVPRNNGIALRTEGINPTNCHAYRSTSGTDRSRTTTYLAAALAANNSFQRRASIAW